MMEDLFGVKGTKYDDVFFTEKSIQNVTPIKHLKVEISRQNADLNQVKKRMAKEAKSIGATVIMNFCYGQRQHKWWQYVFTFKWDTESWYGEGDAVKS